MTCPTGGEGRADDVGAGRGGARDAIKTRRAGGRALSPGPGGPGGSRNGGGCTAGVGSRPRLRVRGGAVCLGPVLRTRCDPPTLSRSGEVRASWKGGELGGLGA